MADQIQSRLEETLGLYEEIPKSQAEINEEMFRFKDEIKEEMADIHSKFDKLMDMMREMLIIEEIEPPEIVETPLDQANSNLEGPTLVCVVDQLQAYDAELGSSTAIGNPIDELIDFKDDRGNASAIKLSLVEYGNNFNEMLLPKPIEEQGIKRNDGNGRIEGNVEIERGVIPFAKLQSGFSFGGKGTDNGTANGSPKTWFEESTSSLKVVLNQNAINHVAHKVFNEMSQSFQTVLMDEQVNDLYTNGFNFNNLTPFDPGGGRKYAMSFNRGVVHPLISKAHGTRINGMNGAVSLLRQTLSAIVSGDKRCLIASNHFHIISSGSHLIFALIVDSIAHGDDFTEMDLKALFEETNSELLMMMLSFDLGGFSLSQMCCVPFGANGELEDYYLVTIMASRNKHCLIESNYFYVFSSDIKDIIIVRIDSGNHEDVFNSVDAKLDWVWDSGYKLIFPTRGLNHLTLSFCTWMDCESMLHSSEVVFVPRTIALLLTPLMKSCNSHPKVATFKVLNKILSYEIAYIKQVCDALEQVSLIIDEDPKSYHKVTMVLYILMWAIDCIHFYIRDVDYSRLAWSFNHSWAHVMNQEMKNVLFTGARKLVVMVLFPTCCDPYYLCQYYSKKRKCFHVINDMIPQINVAVKYMVDELNEELKDATLIIQSEVGIEYYPFIVFVANIVWDPDQSVIFIYILEDKDVHERVGKRIIPMVIQLAMVCCVTYSSSNCSCMNEFVKLLCTREFSIGGTGHDCIQRLIDRSAGNIDMIQAWEVCWANSTFDCLPSFPFYEPIERSMAGDIIPGANVEGINLALMMELVSPLTELWNWSWLSRELLTCRKIFEGNQRRSHLNLALFIVGEFQRLKFIVTTEVHDYFVISFCKEMHSVVAKSIFKKLAAWDIDILKQRICFHLFGVLCQCNEICTIAAVRELKAIASMDFHAKWKPINPWRHFLDDRVLTTVSENGVWDPRIFHLTTLRTRRLLRGRICHK